MSPPPPPPPPTAMGAAEHALASMLPSTTTAELDDLEPIASSSGWPISLLFVLFLAISVAFEKGIKRAEAALERRGSAGLLRALRSALNELLVFGVLSLTLSFLSPTLARICVPIAAVGSDGGSGLSGGNGDDDPQQAAATAAAVSAGGPTTPLLGGGGGHGHARRLLSGGIAALVECPAGRAPLYTAESIHDSHVFLLFVAVSHIAYSAATMALCLWRVNRWRRWEEEGGEEEGGKGGKNNSSSAGGAQEEGSGGVVGRFGAWARRAARPARRALRGLKQRLDDRKKAAAESSSSAHHHHFHHHHRHNDHVLAAPTRVLRLNEGVVAALGRNRLHAALLATINQYRVGISEPIYLGIRRLFMERLAAAAAAGAMEAVEGGKEEEEDEEGKAAEAEAPPMGGDHSPSPAPSQAPPPKLALAFDFHTFLRRSFELEFAGITDVEASLLFVGAAIVAVPPIFRAWALAGAALFAALMMAVVGAKLQGVLTQLAAQSHFLFGREALVAEVDALVRRQKQREGEEEDEDGKEAAAKKEKDEDGGDGAFAGVLGQANDEGYDGGADMRARITPTFAGLGVRSPPRLREEAATGAPAPRPHPPALLVPAPDDGSVVAAAEVVAAEAAEAAATASPAATTTTDAAASPSGVRRLLSHPSAAAAAAADPNGSLATTSAPSVPLSSPQRVRQAQRAAFAGRPAALLMMPPSPVAGVSHSSNRSERTAAAAAAAAGLLGSARSPSPTPRPAAKALRRTTRHIGRQHDNLRHRLAPAGRRPLGPFGRKGGAAGGADAAGAAAEQGVTADALFWFGKPRLLLAAAKLAYFLYGFMLAIVLFAAYKQDGVLAAASMGWQLAAGLGLAAAALAMTLHNALHVLPCFALVMTSAREATAQAASFLQQQQAAREAEALMARPCAGEWLAAALAREARAQRELRRERRRRRQDEEAADGGQAARAESPLPAAAAAGEAAADDAA